MKKIFLCSPSSIEGKRLLHALRLELEERGAEITFDISDVFDTAITVPSDDDDLFRALMEKGVTVFCIYYESEELPDGVVPIIRPISFEKFAESLLRSPTSEVKSPVEMRELVYVNGVLSYGADKISLSETEARLFAILYKNRRKPVTRDQIKDELWGEGESNVVEVYISYLRKKLDIRYDKKFIVTVRNKGYMLL